MPLGKSFDDIVKERLKVDSEFRKESLKGAIECLDAGEFRIAEKMLRLQVEATIGYEKIGELMGKTPDAIKQILHPDYDTSVNDLFEIIGHVQRHEGVRLEVKVCSGEQGCESVAHDEPAESIEARKPLHPVSPS